MCDQDQDLTYKKVASLWIKEIYRGLINKEKQINVNDALKFDTSDLSIKDEEFVSEILDKLHPFTSNFLSE